MSTTKRLERLSIIPCIMSYQSTPKKLVFLVGFVCLISPILNTHCADYREELALRSKTALGFLRSERSQKLASVDEKLDIEQVRKLLEEIRDSPDQEFITQEGAARIIKASQVETNPCNDETFLNLFQIVDFYRAFPNIQNFAKYHRLEQFKKCPSYIKKASIEHHRFQLGRDELDILDKYRPRNGWRFLPQSRRV